MAAKQTKTVTFVWRGKDKTGRKAKGEMQSSSAMQVKMELRKQGIMVTRVTKKSFSFDLGGGQIKPLDIALFTRQMATMMKSGVPLLQAFDITVDGLDKKAMRELVGKVKNEVASGSTFADALRKQPEYFDELYCNLVASGEQSGALDTLLDRIATYKEKTEALKAKIKKALNYPIAVVCIAIIVTVILLVKVVPQFEEVFQGFGAELPAFTQLVINISEAVQSYWHLVIGSMVLIGFFVKRTVKSSKSARNTMDRMMLKLPIVGDILHKSAVARFGRTLATTFAAGVPLVEALDSVAGAAGNAVYADAAKQIKEDVSTGQQLQFAMKGSGVFPSMAVQMVSIGEESGTLDEMLEKVAVFYEDEVDNMVDGLTSLMEPIIMSVLGVLVGGLIVAMYLPIFQLGAAV